MKKGFKAKINWMMHKDGGRKNLPSQGTRYCPLIQINSGEKQSVWSIDFVCPNFKETNIISFTFLVEDAPDELLESNKIYNIYEGAKKVAELEIIELDF